MTDDEVGHMTEKVVIPEADDIDIKPRNFTKKKPGEYLPFGVEGKSLVPEMVKVGDGHKIHVTGLTHDARGYPVMNPDCQEELIHRLIGKIQKNADKIILMEEDFDDAEIVVISYGITSRIAMRAVAMAKEKGIKAGNLRLVTIWPFPEKRIQELAGKVKAFIVPEMNMGQLTLEVERCTGGRARTFPITQAGGRVHKPGDILKVIMEAAK
jgi:2-oxoglutarate ferredoxin oxidoreductase subunit alpha